MMNRFKFEAIFDFTALRTTLFASSKSNAKPAVVAALVNQQNLTSVDLEHVIIRKNSAAAENVAFETDTYDIHRVSIREALDLDHIWQSNFMGGGRLGHFLRKIADARPLGDYLKIKRSGANWVVGEGFKVGDGSKVLERAEALAKLANPTESERAEFEVLKQKYEAAWITGKPFLDHRKFNAAIDIQKIIHQYSGTNRFFLHSKSGNDRISKQPSRKIFEAPHVVVKLAANDQNLPVTFSTDYFTFKHQLFGIYAPWEEVAQLKKVATYLENELIVPVLWLISGQMVCNREAVPLTKDILSLPYPDKPFEIDLVERTLLRDITDFQIDFRKNGPKSKVLKSIAKPDDPILQAYAEWFLNVLNTVYDDFMALPPVVSDQFICFPFVWGERVETDIPASIDQIEAKLLPLLNYRHSHQLWIRRIVRVYEKNVIFIYKPNQIRYWTRSIAINDADATFADFVEQGF